MNRIDQLFQKTKANKTAAFISYLVAGDPDLDTTVELVKTLEQAGSDLIELGVPFSDPLADGLVNQLGAQRALESGTTLPGILRAVEKIRTFSQIPIVLFTYFNPIFHYGLEKFLTDAEKAQIDGILLLDFPPEEAAKKWPNQSALKRINLIAPTTPPERVASIAKNSSGFIYYVSREGVTGMQEKLPENITRQINLIRSATPLPICVGFGISSPTQAKTVAQTADGVVVGSAIVDCIAQNGKQPDLLEKVHQFVSPLTQATHLK